MPSKANQWEKFYEKAWNPANFSAEKSKVYVQDAYNTMTHAIQLVADLVGAEVEIVVTKDASKSISGRFPYLETADGTVISESEAILKHICRQNENSGLLGKNPFEQAKINEWIAWTQTSWLPKMHPASFAIFGYGKPDGDKFTNDVKAMKEASKILDGYLKGKTWLVGDSFSLADIFVGSCMLSSF